MKRLLCLILLAASPALANVCDDPVPQGEVDPCVTVAVEIPKVFIDSLRAMCQTEFPRVRGIGDVNLASNPEQLDGPKCLRLVLRDRHGAFIVRATQELAQAEFARVVTEAQQVAVGQLGPPEALMACGDGIIDAIEQCDDGNRINGDDCSEDCQLEP